MKFTKIFSVALLAVAFASCSNGNEFNDAAGVSVDMKDATLVAVENATVFNVPVVVTGEPNGPVEVTVKTAPVGNTPAVDDKNYYVTSKTIIIPADSKTASIEIMPVNDNDENDPRTFEVTIVDAKGATIGSTKTTVVTIKDDDQDPYLKMAGNWHMTGVSVFKNGEDADYTLKMVTPDPSSPEYGKILTASGVLGSSLVYSTFSYAMDEATGDFTLELVCGTPASGNVNFGDFTGVFYGASIYSQDTSFGPNIPLTATVDAKGQITGMTAPADAMYFMKILSNGASMGYFEGWAEVKFEKQ